MWVCKGHAGFSVAHRLKDWGEGIRPGKGVRTDGLAGPLPSEGSAPCLEKSVCCFLSQFCTSLMGIGGLYKSFCSQSFLQIRMLHARGYVLLLLKSISLSNL